MCLPCAASHPTHTRLIQNHFQMADQSVLAIQQNPALFLQLVEQLQNADNDRRKEAEAIFEGLKKQPDLIVTCLADTLSTCPNVEARVFCGVMIRKVGPPSAGTPPAQRPVIEGLPKLRCAGAGLPGCAPQRRRGPARRRSAEAQPGP